jgi:hypothetical protein
LVVDHEIVEYCPLLIAAGLALIVTVGAAGGGGFEETVNAALPLGEPRPVGPSYPRTAVQR